MIEAKATLIKRETPIGTVAEDVPMGQVYTVYPESIQQVSWRDLKTGEKGSLDMIFTAARGSRKAGWFPLECLKLEDS